LGEISHHRKVHVLHALFPQSAPLDDSTESSDSITYWRKPLVDRLVARGYTDLAVLDVSSTALEIARRRLGDAAPVHWLHEDLLSWQPERRYALWHDRAVFHFLTDAAERAKYLTIMRQTLGDSGALIIATFASDGPERCSGLPVARYDAVDLERLLDGFTVVESSREEHVTPGGTVQPFTWIAATREGAQASS